MKVSRKLALLALVLAGSIGMTGCKSNAKMPVNFVAVTSSDYNATVTFGDYDYKFQGKITQGSSTFTLVGNAVARHAGSSGGGQGGGFPGGFGPGGQSTGPTFEGFGAAEADPGQQQGGGEGEGQGNPFDPGQQSGGEGQGQGNPFDPGQQQGDPGQQQGDPGQSGNPFDPGQQQGDPGQQQGGEQQTVAPTSLSLSLSLEQAYINQTVSATVSAQPENASKDVTWSTSNEAVATVNNGSISPIAEGTVTITATSTVDESVSASATLKVVKENLAEHNWSITASCAYEKGYGYKIVFNDTDKTEVHTDFDRTEGRHEFYYRVKIGEESQVLKFQAKDPTFKDSLAKDYKKWDERDAKYIFCAKATGNNNSVATAYLYLHKTNNEVTVNSPNGANRSLEFGLKWQEENGVITLIDGDKTYTADNSVNAEHPGYRLIYDSKTYYCSLNPDFKWKKFTTADFEGANTFEFVGSYTTTGPDGGTKEVNLNCVGDGKAKLYLGSTTASFVGTWTKDASNKLSITFEDKTGEFVPGADGKYDITIRVGISSFFGSSTEIIVLTQVK